MELYPAKVADIVRCSQRDNMFVQSFENEIISLLETCGIRNYNRIRKIVPALANLWYYFLTSLDNIQTLGEEYTGILRVTNSNNVPSKMVQIVWLTLYVGGETLYDRLFQNMREHVSSSPTLLHKAKRDLLRFITFMQDNKLIFLRLHQSTFYIDGIYYNIANRVTGLKYVLLRQWLQDDSSTSSFKLLGKITLSYLLYILIRQGWILQTQLDSNSSNTSSNSSNNAYSYAKLCSLCADTRKNTSATPCGHLFCWECIHEALKVQQCCPICREVVIPSRIVLLQNYA